MKLDDWGRYDSARSLAHRRGSSCRTRNDVAIERGSYQDSRMAGWIPMRCGFKNPKSADGPYRSQCWTTPSAAGASTNGAPGPFLRWAQRATSVLAWIACAATRSPCGQAEALPPQHQARIQARQMARRVLSLGRDEDLDEKGGARVRLFTF